MGTMHGNLLCQLDLIIYFLLTQKSWSSYLVIGVKTTCDVVPQKQADIPEFPLNY